MHRNGGLPHGGVKPVGRSEVALTQSWESNKSLKKIMRQRKVGLQKFEEKKRATLQDKA
jgi:hypothetical protein